MTRSTIGTVSHQWQMLLLAVSLVCLAIVSACSDGGGPPSEPSSDDSGGISTPIQAVPLDDGIVAEGVYTGEITSTVTGETLRLVAFADGAEIIRFVTRHGQYFGLFFVNDVPLTGITTAGHTWLDGSTKSSFSFQITKRWDEKLQGTYAGAGDQGTWLLAREPRRSDYPDEGLYLLHDEAGNHIATFEISAGGTTIYGSDVDGCVFSGTLEFGLVFWWLYYVNLTVENCPSGTEGTSNGDYRGSGGLTPGPGWDQVLTLAVDNGEQALLLDLEKL